MFFFCYTMLSGSCETDSNGNALKTYRILYRKTKYVSLFCLIYADYDICFIMLNTFFTFYTYILLFEKITIVFTDKIFFSIQSLTFVIYFFNKEWLYFVMFIIFTLIFKYYKFYTLFNIKNHFALFSLLLLLLLEKDWYDTTLCSSYVFFFFNFDMMRHVQ